MRADKAGVLRTLPRSMNAQSAASERRHSYNRPTLLTSVATYKPDVQWQLLRQACWALEK